MTDSRRPTRRTLVRGSLAALAVLASVYALTAQPPTPGLPPPVPNVVAVPDVAAPVVAPAPARSGIQFSIRQRYQNTMSIDAVPSQTEPGLTQVIVGGGVNLIINQPKTAANKLQTLDIEADRMVFWTRGSANEFVTNMKSTQNDDGNFNEVFLSGNVEIRTRTDKSVDTLRADSVYYDFRRNVAIARQADLEILLPRVPVPLHVKTDELIQVNQDLRQTKNASIFASLLPSDPGLTFDVSNVTVETRRRERSYLYGLIPAYDKEGKRIIDVDDIFTGRNMFINIEGVPVFYFPYFRGRVEDPLGPLESVNLSYNRILGFQVYTTWDMYDLLDLPHYEGTRWRLYLDGLTDRGPAIGTEFDFSGQDYFGIKGNYKGLLKLYGIYDGSPDIIGGDRGNFIYWPDRFTTWPISHPEFRGIAHGKLSVQEMDNGFSILGQFAFIRDRNFLEQFYYDSQLNDPNYNTFLQVKQQQANWAWTVGGQISTREWVTETDWLPRGDAYLLGQTLFDDLLVYNMHASAGYARLRPTSVVPFAFFPTDVRTDTLRLDLWQDVSLPFYLGPVKMAPYLAADLAYYSNDVNGDGAGRLYGGGGVRASIPFSRVYPDIQSELFNLNQIDHKIVLTGNYYIAQASNSFNRFPQLDRLNDDASDQAIRDIRPWQPLFNPLNAGFLTTSPLFNPQTYAIRRLVDTSPDTLDSINVLQLGVRQRWQTQRGFADREHTIDWMTLNVQASLFPNANRDNFGQTLGIVEYDWLWNIGDRTGLISSGWFEPFSGGPRAFDFGAFVRRPDSSAFYLGYRQIDPLQSKAIVANVTYPFSAKYALQASTVWDFGNNIRNYSFFVSRLGTDLLVNFGLNYNSTLNTFGIAFEVTPNLARRGRSAAVFPMAATNIDPVFNQR